MNDLYLPNSIEVDGKSYMIDADFRNVLLIMQMYNEKDLSAEMKHMTFLSMLYSYYDEDRDEIVTDIPENTTEALMQGFKFLNKGKEDDGSGSSKQKTLDYEKDSGLIFSALIELLKSDIRAEKFFHWYSFIDSISAISGDSTLSYVTRIRQKRLKGEKLETHEADFFKKNRGLVLMQDEYELEKTEDEEFKEFLKRKAEKKKQKMKEKEELNELLKQDKFSIVKE